MYDHYWRTQHALQRGSNGMCIAMKWSTFADHCLLTFLLAALMATGLMTVGKLGPFGGWQYLYRLEVVIELATVGVAEYCGNKLLAGSNSFSCWRSNAKTLPHKNFPLYTRHCIWHHPKVDCTIKIISEHALTCPCVTHAERTAVLQRKNAGTLYVSNMSSVSFSLFCFVFHYAGWGTGYWDGIAKQNRTFSIGIGYLMLKAVIDPVKGWNPRQCFPFHPSLPPLLVWSLPPSLSPLYRPISVLCSTVQGKEQDAEMELPCN